MKTPSSSWQPGLVVMDESFTPDKDTSGGKGRSWEKAILAKEEVMYPNIVIHFLAFTNDCKHSCSESVSDCHGQVH